MGVDTKGYVPSTVTAKEIYDVLLTLHSGVVNYVKEKGFGTNPQQQFGWINFEVEDVARAIFLSESVPCESYMSGLMFENDKYTWLSMSKDDHSVEIMTKLVSVFGGYIDEDDCDSIEPWETYIPKGDNFNCNDFVLTQNKVIAVLDEDLKMDDKIRIARQIMKHYPNIVMAVEYKG